MSFDHRVEGNNPYELDSYQLVSAIHSMTQRAEAVIKMLETEYSMDKGGRLDDESMFLVLHSVRMEVLDIRSTVSSYHDFQRSLKQKESNK